MKRFMELCFRFRNNLTQQGESGCETIAKLLRSCSRDCVSGHAATLIFTVSVQ